MKLGSKYYSLFEHLQQQAQLDNSECITLTLDAIEQLITGKLPASAQRRAWWSNRDSTSALQASAWIEAGYHVETVDFEVKAITFCKFKATYTIQRDGEKILWEQQSIRALRKHMGLTQAKFAAELGVRRQTVSEWENGVYEPDRSTAKHLELIAQQKAFAPE